MRLWCSQNRHSTDYRRLNPVKELTQKRELTDGPSFLSEKDRPSLPSSLQPATQIYMWDQTQNKDIPPLFQPCQRFVLPSPSSPPIINVRVGEQADRKNFSSIARGRARNPGKTGLLFLPGTGGGADMRSAKAKGDALPTR